MIDARAQFRRELRAYLGLMGLGAVWGVVLVAFYNSSALLLFGLFGGAAVAAMTVWPFIPLIALKRLPAVLTWMLGTATPVMVITLGVGGPAMAVVGVWLASFMAALVLNRQLPDVAVRPPAWLCDACRYDLRGAAGPVCPECGTRSEWFDNHDRHGVKKQRS